MPRREKSICAFALAAVLALGACSSDRRTKYIERPAAPAPTAAQTSLNEAEAARVALVRAQAALTAAQARQAEAEAALRDALAALAAETQGTPEYAAAQTALTAAQTALTAARAAFVSAQRQEQTARTA